MNRGWPRGRKRGPRSPESRAKQSVALRAFYNTPEGRAIQADKSRPKHSPEFVAQARAYWATGMRCCEIAQLMGVSRSIMAGLAYRHEFQPYRGLSRRQAA